MKFLVKETTRLVTPTGTSVRTLEPGIHELNEVFTRAAIAAGLPVVADQADIEAAQGTKAEEPALDQDELIRQAIEELIAANDSSKFTEAGRPRVNAVNNKLPFKATSDEIDAVFETMKN